MQHVHVRVGRLVKYDCCLCDRGLNFTDAWQCWRMLTWRLSSSSLQSKPLSRQMLAQPMTATDGQRRSGAALARWTAPNMAPAMKSLAGACSMVGGRSMEGKVGRTNCLSSCARTCAQVPSLSLSVANESCRPENRHSGDGYLWLSAGYM